MIARALIAIALCAAASVASAQPAGSAGSGAARTITIPLDAEAPEVSAAASPSDIRLGSRFTLFVTAAYSPGVQVNLREPFALGPAFEVKKRVATDSVRPDGRYQREWQIEVFAWDLGDLLVPPVAVTFTAHGQAGQVETNAVPVRVTGVLGDADDPKLMRPYAPPIELRQHTWLWRLAHNPEWPIAGAIVLVAAYLIARRLRRPRRAAPRARTSGVVGWLASAAPVADMTSERALERLREIERSGALGRDDERKAAYADMADVMRAYAGARYGVATARELTTGELLEQIARRASEREVGLVAAWLERCDPVKYGGARATAAAAAQVLDGAREVIAETSKRTGAAA